MVNICGICNGELRYITDVPGSSRGNSIHVCNQCAMLQLVGSPEYEASKDPHSLRYSGERHVAAASGARVSFSIVQARTSFIPAVK